MRGTGRAKVSPYTEGGAHPPVIMPITLEISAAAPTCRRVPIDVDRARAQHTAYEWALVEAGCTVRRLDSGPDMPDAVFVEDIAVVIAEGAILSRPGSEARRIETAGVVASLVRHGLPLQEIRSPGTLDGGDVLVDRPPRLRRSLRAHQQALPSTSSSAILDAVGYTVSMVPVARLPALEIGGHGHRSRYRVDQSRVGVRRGV